MSDETPIPSAKDEIERVLSMWRGDGTYERLHHFVGEDQNCCGACGGKALDGRRHLAFAIIPKDQRQAEAARALEIYLHIRRDEIARRALEAVISSEWIGTRINEP